MQASVVMALGPSYSVACGILVPHQGSNLRPLLYKADSQPLDHQGNPPFFFFFKLSLSYRGFLGIFPLIVPDEILLYTYLCPVCTCVFYCISVCVLCVHVYSVSKKKTFCPQESVFAPLGEETSHRECTTVQAGRWAWSRERGKVQEGESKR